MNRPTPELVGTSVEMALNQFDAVEEFSVFSDDGALYIELPFPECDPDVLNNVVRHVAGAYIGSIAPLFQNPHPIPVDRAVIDLLNGEGDDLRYRYEIPNGSIRDCWIGKISEEALLEAVLTSSHVVGEDGTPRSTEEAFKLELERETDIDVERIDIQEFSRQIADEDADAEEIDIHEIARQIADEDADA